MKKFEEELFSEVPCKFGLSTEGEYNQSILVKHFGDWVSPEDHQAEITKLKNEINWLHNLLDGRNEEVLQTVKQLNEAIPEIPEVPQFVADWLEYCKEMQVSLYFAVTYFSKVASGKITEGSSSYDDYGYGVSEENSKLVRHWFTNDVQNHEKLALAFITGKYEVEKPQLFRVCLLDGRHTLTRRDPRKTLPFNYTFLWSYSSELKEMREINREVDLFTEQEIKSIDERYWQFAVPVEDGE
ncbi:DUF1642 domain-containing protein [Lactococcus garvieae]|uniref:DUF1642 domain-containing protein n=1 Tax=Lactococcus garvieae TaxID=1363 RepID=UPI001CE2B849|nr:DUF1642 domain-containing protein [Lactococcus garvieae]